MKIKILLIAVISFAVYSFALLNLGTLRVDSTKKEVEIKQYKLSDILNIQEKRKSQYSEYAKWVNAKEQAFNAESATTPEGKITRLGAKLLIEVLAGYYTLNYLENSYLITELEKRKVDSEIYNDYVIPHPWVLEDKISGLDRSGFYEWSMSEKYVNSGRFKINEHYESALNQQIKLELIYEKHKDKEVFYK